MTAKLLMLFGVLNSEKPINMRDKILFVILLSFILLFMFNNGNKKLTLTVVYSFKTFTRNKWIYIKVYNLTAIQCYMASLFDSPLAR